jgi:uncharacterized protein YdhG (YjbR/CyaY superfamily)
MDKEFLNKGQFSQLVEKQVHEKRMSYIEAIIAICDENNLDPEDVGKYISNIVKDKIEAEARSLNFLPKHNTLPI